MLQPLKKVGLRYALINIPVPVKNISNRGFRIQFRSTLQMQILSY